MDEKVKAIEYIVELESYVKILSDYMDMHENIEEFLHASLLVTKMQENIQKLSKFFFKVYM